MFAALMIGYHFSISAFWKAPSASGVYCSRGGTDCPRSKSRECTAGLAKGKQPQRSRSRPLQALHDGAAHHPVLVALAEEAQLFREMADALAVARLGVRIREIGAPVAALRAVGVEHAFQVHRDVAERIGLARNAGRGRHLNTDVRVSGRERYRCADRD